MNDLIYKYWGKAKRKEDGSYDYHLLVYHCLDVAAVGKVYFQKSPALIKSFSKFLQIEEKQAENIVLFLISLHDIGKFDIRFQSKVEPVLLKMQPDVKNQYRPEISRRYDHGEEGYRWINAEIYDYGLENEDCLFDWIKRVTGHHGRFPQNNGENPPPFTKAFIKRRDCDARKSFVTIVKKFFLGNYNINNLPINVIPLFAGFCCVCDWLGSNENYFSFCKDVSNSENTMEDLHEYYSYRLVKATEALSASGLLSKCKYNVGILNLFPEYTPMGVQKFSSSIDKEQSLTIIEAPTGSGKTEAALAMASKLLNGNAVDSIVFALPTQATANAMLQRIEDVADKIFDGGVNVVLAHGKSGFNKNFIAIKNKEVDFASEDDSFVQCTNWLSTSRKRAFLGQIGVCTIDQVLLSVLPVKHYFMRSFGLGKSVLIVDEVHAYDSYMYGLLTEVLREQKLSGGSVILLSATLPFSQKSKLIEAWGYHEDQKKTNSYPLVTHIPNDNMTLLELDDADKPEIFNVFLNKTYSNNLTYNSKSISNIYEDAKKGAVIGVICNLVADAQFVAKQLHEIDNGAFDIDIFHSRYRFYDRLEKENNVIKKYGKKSERKGKILVATQVVEQSLDLDFDCLYTQLCPIDLLFQRIGRLHRHERKRPSQFEKPTATIILPEKELEFGDSGKYVYQNLRAMWRTQKLLAEVDQIQFPDAYREWIEQVYDDNPWEIEYDKLLRIADNYQGEQIAKAYHAKTLVNGKDTINPFDDFADEAMSLTRDGEMSINLIPVVMVNDKMCFLNEKNINELEEWGKYENFNMNSVPVPHSWKYILEPFEEGYMKLIMKKICDNEWEAIVGNYRIIYSLERGMERITL